MNSIMPFPTISSNLCEQLAHLPRLLKLRYDKKLDRDGVDFISYITNGVNQMHSLLTDLQIYAQVGIDDILIESVSLDGLISDILKILRKQIEESNAQIFMDDLPTISANRSGVHQLFQNLISNAIKFSGDKSPIIHIRYERENEFHTIRVSDNGIGIPEIYHQQIFVAFKRLHTQEEFPGSGIGLAICQKVVQQHKGYIKVESSPGKGATFIVQFPA